MSRVARGSGARALCWRPALGLVLTVAASTAGSEPASPHPAPADPHGTLTIVGSDTLGSLVQRWTTMFRARHPGVRIQLQTPGSASAPLALIEGATDLGAMSRPMSEDEQRSFRTRYGYDATGIVVAHDAIVVIVHPDNPLRAITRKQLDAVYSSTRRCGADAPIESWDALGVSVGGPTRRVLPVGRNEASGTSEFFRENALCGGRYRADMVAWPGHGATVAAVAANPEAIGYVGFGSLNGLVKPLAYAPRDDAPVVAPVMENVMDGDYALSRPLYLYVNRPRGRGPAPIPSAFLAYVLGDEAQAAVAADGFLALSLGERSSQLDRILGTEP
ncbi:MAG TPA: phosphate ABC transporter substrate-binding protein [Rhodanobacteraceae bacterium]|nr:phosphate ABC transporter substrate-binding protein [Rhodanobacteraceae bacterium]